MIIRSVPIDSTVSNADGFYQFSEVDLFQTYMLQFVEADHIAVAIQNFGVNNMNSAGANGFTAEVELFSNVCLNNIDRSI